jgi:hypothetical protein
MHCITGSVGPRAALNAKYLTSNGNRTLAVLSVVATQAELCRLYVIAYLGVCDYRRDWI